MHSRYTTTSVDSLGKVCTRLVERLELLLRHGHLRIHTLELHLSGEIKALIVLKFWGDNRLLLLACRSSRSI